MMVKWTVDSRPKDENKNSLNKVLTFIFGWKMFYLFGFVWLYAYVYVGWLLYGALCADCRCHRLYTSWNGGNGH